MKTPAATVSPLRGQDEGLRFFLDFAQTEGAAWEQVDEKALVLLPGALRDTLDLPEELMVTADPEVAREDGALLLTAGHPVLEGAAGEILERGDVGCSHLPWPSSAPPGAHELVARARGLLQVDHGRIDGAGLPPRETRLPLLRLGVLVTYSTSIEDRFQEREEVWVDARNGLTLGATALSRVASGLLEPGTDGSRPLLPMDLPAAIASAHDRIEHRAIARRLELSRHSRHAREQELGRAAAYYEAALESIAARSTTASPERRGLLEAQAEVTSLERERRLTEIQEKFEPSHEIRPFRLHLIGVPALAVPVHIRRGDRMFPLTLIWMPGANAFAPVGCPHCGGAAALVAGRSRLGCRDCLPRLPVEPARIPHAAAPAVPGRSLLGPPQRPPPSNAGPSAPQGVSGVPAGSRSAGALPAEGRGSAPSSAARAARSGQSRGQGSRGRSNGARDRAKPSSLRREIDDERLSRRGDKLANAFWDAAVLGERWRRKATMPDSPMSALARLYGSVGSLAAIGIPPAARILSLANVNLETAARPGLPHATSGVIRTNLGIHPYTLRWAPREGRALVVEVLANAATGAALLPLEFVPRISAVQLLDPPAPRIPLDPVAAQIWEEVMPVHGLPFVIRCLAAWWLVEAAPGTDAYGPAAMAGALVEETERCARLASMTSRQARLWSANPSEVADAASHVSAVIGSPGERPW